MSPRSMRIIRRFCRLRFVSVRSAFLPVPATNTSKANMETASRWLLLVQRSCLLAD